MTETATTGSAASVEPDAPPSIPPNQAAESKSTIDRFIANTLGAVDQAQAATDKAEKTENQKRLEDFVTRLTTMFGPELVDAFAVSLESPVSVRLVAPGYKPIIVTVAGVFRVVVGKTPWRGAPNQAMAPPLVAAKQ